MNHSSCVAFLEFFGFVHDCDGRSVKDDEFNLVFPHIDASPLSRVSACKDLGNDLYRQNHVEEASACYDKACQLLCFVLKDGFGTDLNLYANLAISLCLNLAACAIKLQAFEGALILCSMVLNYFPRHVKALFRKAISLRRLNKLQEARSSLEEAILVEPQNKDILRELGDIKKLPVLNQNGKRMVEASSHATEIGEEKQYFSSHGNHEASASNVAAMTENINVAAMTENCQPNMSCDNNATSSSLANMGNMELGNRSTFQFDLLGKNKEVLPSTPHVGFGRTSSGVLDCMNENYPSSVVDSDYDNATFRSSASTSEHAQFIFTNKKHAHKRLKLSAHDYNCLLLGKKITYFHPRSGAVLRVRPLTPKNSTQPGTLHDDLSWEAAVPNSVPLLDNSQSENLYQAVDIDPASNHFKFNDEAAHSHVVKKSRLSTMKASDHFSEVTNVSLSEGFLDQPLKVSSIPLPSPSQFVFSAATKTHSRAVYSSFVGISTSRHCLTRVRTKVMNKSVLQTKLSSTFCRFQETQERGIGSKRKDDCSFLLDHHPRLKNVVSVLV